VIFKLWFSLGSSDVFGLGVDLELLQDDGFDCISIMVGPLYFWAARHFGYDLRIFGKQIAG